MRKVLLCLPPRKCIELFLQNKTLDVKNSRPLFSPPFQCFLYCTKANATRPDELFELCGPDLYWKGNGRVIGDFVCDDVRKVSVVQEDDVRSLFCDLDLRGAMLSDQEIAHIIEQNRDCWAWHITNFHLYKHPLDLMDFYSEDVCRYRGTSVCYHPQHCLFEEQHKDRNGNRSISPPVSWCCVPTAEQKHQEERE